MYEVAASAGKVLSLRGSKHLEIQDTTEPDRLKPGLLTRRPSAGCAIREGRIPLGKRASDGSEKGCARGWIYGFIPVV